MTHGAARMESQRQLTVAAEAGELACGTQPRRNASIAEVSRELEETTRRSCRHYLGLDTPTDANQRLEGRHERMAALVSFPQNLCYCESVKNITVSVPDEVYRNARVAAAQRDTSLSALVVKYLERLSGRMDEFARLEALQHEVQAEIGQFRAADRLSRDEVHDRAVR